jgi:secondary thiamine-phosphate synthase enzyme
MTYKSEIRIQTSGDGDMVDLSAHTADCIRTSGIRDGFCSVHVAGSTAAITTIEFEPGLKEDFPAALERLAARSADYAHNRTWGDGNGFSHVRASILGPGIVVPIWEGHPVLGQWQQPVLVECDNRPRQRTIFLTVVGE